MDPAGWPGLWSGLHMRHAAAPSSVLSPGLAVCDGLAEEVSSGYGAV